MIRLEKDGSLWTVTLDRADKANALTREMLEDLAGIARAAETGAKALILTGEGRVFSAGMDLAEAETGGNYLYVVERGVAVNYDVFEINRNKRDGGLRYPGHYQ